MKISNKILLGLLAAIALHVLTGMVIVRSTLAPGGIGSGETIIEGLGNSKKVEFPIGDFNHIMIEGNYKVMLHQGKPYAAIEADENIIEYLDFGVEDGKETLSLKAKEGYSLVPKNPVTIYIGFEHLESIAGYGFTNFVSEKELTFEELAITMHGAGMFNVPLTAKTLELRLDGSCEAYLTGSIDLLEANISGVCRLHSEDLVAKKAEITLSGSSTADIQVTDYLEARTAGNSVINYIGNPQTDNRSSGVSAINQK